MSNQAPKTSATSIEVVNGTLKYVAKAGEAGLELGRIQAHLRFPSGSGPLRLDGEGIWGERRIGVSLATALPSHTQLGRPTRLEAQVRLGRITLRVDGSLSHANAFAFTGTFQGRTDENWRDRGAILSRLGARGPHIPFTLDANLSVNNGELAFQQIQGRIDRMSVAGDLRYLSKATTSALTGSIELEEFDISRVVAQLIATLLDGADMTGSLTTAGQLASGFASMLNVQVRADVVARERKAPGQRGLNGDLAIRVDRGAMGLTFRGAQFYRGLASGEVRFDGAASPPHVSGRVVLEGVDIGTFLQECCDANLLSGATSATISIETRGGDIREMASNFSGEASIEAQNGEIHGIDLKKTARTVNLTGADQTIGERYSSRFIRFDSSLRMDSGSIFLQYADFTALDFVAQIRGQIGVSERVMQLSVLPRPSSVSSEDAGVPFLLEGTWREPRVRSGS